jgi:TRAP-type mannitol/chloroaromatic compound transport system permease large subunit
MPPIFYISMWLVIIILGAFLDWIGIVMIVVPLFTPIAAKLGFDPIWFAMMNRDNSTQLRVQFLRTR